MAGSRPTVLIVDDDSTLREVLKLRLEGWDYPILEAPDGASATKLVAEHDPDIVVSDVVLPSTSGLDLLQTLQEGNPDRVVILMTAHGTVEVAVEALKAGATDFLTKPLDWDRLRTLLEEAEDLLRDTSRVRWAERTVAEEAGPSGIVGRSEPMLEMFDALRRFAASDAPALITGESGTGKERAARAMHELSPRSAGPFVAVNCAAIPEGLMESELFGHEKGAFSGATSARAGCFELADGGTLLLDELAEMPIALQPKLLRILEEGRTRRVGGSREVEFDVRVLAATNQNPQEAMQEGTLREDLYFRVALGRIHLPALRDREGDLPLLAQHFVQEFNSRHDLEIVGLRDDAKAALEAYAWPGNVRELRNVVGRAGILAGNGWIERSHLPRWIRNREGRTPRFEGPGVHLPLGLPVAEVERRYLLATLEDTDFNKSEAARRLEIDVKTVRNKLKQYEAS